VPGLRVAAFEIGVRNIDVARSCIGKTAADIDGRLIVPPAPGQGAFISFLAMPEDAAGAGRSDAHAGRRNAASTVSGASVSLTPREKAFVDEMVASGRFAGTADVVRAGLKLLETREGEPPAADRPAEAAVADRAPSEPAGERENAGDDAGFPRSIDDEL
jgi:putative addiction module CopG family antidote